MPRHSDGAKKAVAMVMTKMKTDSVMSSMPAHHDLHGRHAACSTTRTSRRPHSIAHKPAPDQGDSLPNWHELQRKKFAMLSRFSTPRSRHLLCCSRRPALADGRGQARLQLWPRAVPPGRVDDASALDANLVLVRHKRDLRRPCQRLRSTNILSTTDLDSLPSRSFLPSCHAFAAGPCCL